MVVRGRGELTDSLRVAAWPEPLRSIRLDARDNYRARPVIRLENAVLTCRTLH